ncbi:hypothetical protein ACFWQL_19570 [Amycolatopsis thermoflava]|uniref:hypothetical protein n=1 Tax=Amycolatopsis thermoflava TaxID=84480 RepID=UPI00366217C8
MTPTHARRGWYLLWSLLSIAGFIAALLMIAASAPDLAVGGVVVVLLVAAEGIRRTAPDAPARKRGGR